MRETEHPPGREAGRVGFTILDLMGLVAVAAVAAMGASMLSRFPSDLVRGQTATWLVLAGFATSVGLCYRFIRWRETRLIVMGLVLGFGAYLLDFYRQIFIELIPGSSGSASAGGLMVLSAILVAGGVLDGLLGRHVRPGPPGPPRSEDEASHHA